jgi:DNA-binding NarL/FixJ family response regulator
MTDRIRLLLCDDHALFRAGIKAVLREQAALDVVGEAGDGKTALDLVARLHPDVVLMDVGMPQLNGFEATRRIIRAHPNVRVLILTMYAEEQLVARCLAAGAGGYVLKDVPVSQLVDAIAAVARGERYLTSAVHSAGGRGARRLEAARSRYDRLTEREREVLKLLAEGLTVKQVAKSLDRSVKTIEVHKYNLMGKLDVHDRAGLVKCAIAHRLIHVPVFEDLIGSD